MHLIAVGGSGAGISAALRARELDPRAEVTVVVADAYPSFSICGIPYYVSGEVAHWRNLAHRTYADLEATGMRLRLDTLAKHIDVHAGELVVVDCDGTEETLSYDALMVGTGAVPVAPPMTGLDVLGPEQGVHLLHSMDDTFALTKTLDRAGVSRAVIVGAGYIGLEMAEGLTTRGLQVTQIEQLPEVLPTVDPELGALVHAELERHGVTVACNTRVDAIEQADTAGASASLPGASAPRSSRCSTSLSPAPGSATRRPRRQPSSPSPLPRRPLTTSRTTPAATPSRCAYTADGRDGRLLGLQLLGHLGSEIAKRVDIAATAIHNVMTIGEMSDLDLSYTPPLGSPWDAIQAGAQAWEQASPATARS